jgi:Flp pilus assembly pilin Flp
MITAQRIRRYATRFVRDEKGATLMEYIMLAGLIAIAAFIGFQTFGTDVKTVVNGQAQTVTQIPAAP